MRIRSSSMIQSARNNGQTKNPIQKIKMNYKKTRKRKKSMFQGKI